MGSLFGPKCFLSSAFFITTILSIYGLVGPVFNYLQTTQLQDIGDWPFNVRPLYFAFMVIQCLFLFVGLFAIVAACKKHPMFLLGSGSVLLAIFTSSTVFGIVSYRVSPQEILESVYKTFRKGANDSRIFEWMDEIQLQYKCCGVYSYMDWYTIDNALIGNNKIPSTCCRRSTFPRKNCWADTLSNDSIKTTLDDSIYSQGCGSKLANMSKELSEHLAVEICICGAISLFAALFLYIGVTKYFLAGENSCSPSSNNHQGNGQSNTTAGKPRGNDTSRHDENNNITSGNNFSARKQRSGGNRYKKREQERFNTSMHGPFTSILSQGRVGRSIRGNVSKSKSFIIGDAPSSLLTPIHEEKDPEILRKNVDMLWYQSLDKNMSTLSTTPNDISSMLLPAMLLQNKKMGLGCELISAINDDDASCQRNAVLTLVSERPFTQNLSQNGSSSQVNNNAVKPPAATVTCEREVIETEQPYKQPRHNHKVSEDVYEENELPSVPETALTTAAQFTTEIKNVKTVDVDAFEVIDEDGVTSQQVNSGNTSPSHPPSQPGAKYINPTSSVRSSTLATIQEESESAKCSPTNTKSASPSSGCLTPETVSPKQTATELTSTLDKDDTAVSCAFEVNRTNNNNFNSISDVEPESTV